MQVRQALVASLLAITAVAAMSQEIDPSENLQGRSLAAQREKAAQARERAADAASKPEASGTADAKEGAARTVPDSQHAQVKPRTHARLDLTRWHPARKAVVVGELG